MIESIGLPKNIKKVSVHGGHSGQFCHHANDSLEELVQAYIAKGFSWIGITEHMPPPSDLMRYPDEVEAGISAKKLQSGFKDYFKLGRSLQKKYVDDIDIMVGFEIETYPGSVLFVKEQINLLQPDYVVGSVHHVVGISIDFSVELYQQASIKAGGLEQLYCEYFDAQYNMLAELTPAVVGHFDLIRIFDSAYLERIACTEVWQRIERNLTLIADKKLIMDFNLRGFDKTPEQYPSMPILTKALAMGIAVVPGDDSHSISSVGRNYEKGVDLLIQLGANTTWEKPAKLVY